MPSRVVTVTVRVTVNSRDTRSADRIAADIANVARLGLPALDLELVDYEGHDGYEAANRSGGYAIRHRWI